jgi:diguanylate cyclase (GGDEF)-like protein/PAS domain S-box-containing protein
MALQFTPRESCVLNRLLAENTSDIILKTDRDGFIVQASPAIERLGFPLAHMLIGPHVLDLVRPDSVPAVEAQLDAALNGQPDGNWIEFPALTRDRREHWFAMQLRGLADDRGGFYGALGVMRSIQERRAFEERLFAATMTDPLTGLTNRQAFIAMLRHLVDERIGGCLALFDIDYLTAINMKYGQCVGDEVLVAFSDFLRTMIRATDIVSRVDGEKLGILMPEAAPRQAEAICQRVISTLTELRRSAGADGFAFTASAGIARITGSLDGTLRQADMALFFAKANGRNRLAVNDGKRSLWSRGLRTAA